MEKAARKRFWAPNLRQDVQQAVNACSNCQQLKAVRATPRAPLQSIETGYPYQRLGIDFTGPFTQTRKGNRYLLVMVDFFTKWVVVAAIPSQETRITANAIFSE